MTRILLLAATALVLTGCMSPADRAMRNSQPYQAGYADGCAAANAAGSSYREGPVRNEDAFKASKAYRAGWNTGYGACRRGIQTPGSDPTQSPVPEYGPGHH